MSISAALTSFGVRTASPCGLMMQRPSPTELFRPGWTDEKGHVAPGLGKPAAKVAADRTGADDKDVDGHMGKFSVES